MWLHDTDHQYASLLILLNNLDSDRGGLVRGAQNSRADDGSGDNNRTDGKKHRSEDISLLTAFDQKFKEKSRWRF